MTFRDFSGEHLVYLQSGYVTGFRLFDEPKRELPFSFVKHFQIYNTVLYFRFCVLLVLQLSRLHHICDKSGLPPDY